MALAFARLAVSLTSKFFCALALLLALVLPARAQVTPQLLYSTQISGNSTTNILGFSGPSNTVANVTAILQLSSGNTDIFSISNNGGSCSSWHRATSIVWTSTEQLWYCRPVASNGVGYGGFINFNGAPGHYSYRLTTWSNLDQTKMPVLFSNGYNYASSNNPNINFNTYPNGGLLMLADRWNGPTSNLSGSLSCFYLTGSLRFNCPSFNFSTPIGDTAASAVYAYSIFPSGTPVGSGSADFPLNTTKYWAMTEAIFPTAASAPGYSNQGEPVIGAGPF